MYLELHITDFLENFTSSLFFDIMFERGKWDVYENSISIVTSRWECTVW